MYRCQNICIKNQEPRHLFIKKLYVGFFQTFKTYTYIYEDIYVCFLFKTVFVRFFPQDFLIIPGGFCYLPGEKFTARSHPGKFLKLEIFPIQSSHPQWSTETGCLYVYMLL